MKKSIVDTATLSIAASRLKAISHPMRIAIIALIDDNRELNVTKIYTMLNIRQPVASHHLKVLKRKGVLQSMRRGKESIYSLKGNSFNSLYKCIP